MKGCPLRCQWCSNPESQESYPEIMTIDRKCIKCGKCVEICPEKAITLDESGRRVDRRRCDGCLKCALICPTGAIEIVGKYLNVDQVMAEVLRDDLFYRNSEGGVTISGGEPFLNWQFALELLKRCKAKNIHTALDTCGYAPWIMMEKVLGYVDLVLYDIKLIDSAKHQEATGVTNEIILANAKRVTREKRTWVRYAVIPGFNDSESCAREIARFSSFLHPEKVSLLPYHALGVQKYERLGRIYCLNGVSPPANEYLQQTAEIFESFGLKITIGY
jgi:pyruvate formate lyase activating enzyme